MTMPPSIAIIGGGVIGYVVAWEACRMFPDCEIVLLDRDIPCAGASARSAGLHFPLGRNPVVREMSRYAERYYQDMRETYRDVPIRPLKLRVHASSSDERAVEPLFTSTLVPLDETERAFVTDTLGSRYGVWQVNDAQRADVKALVGFLSQKLDGRLRASFGLHVTGIEETEEKVRIKTQDGLHLEADHVFLCPGPWALSPIFQPFTRDLEIRIKRVVAFHIEENRPLENGAGQTVDLFVDEDAFFMPLDAHGKRLFSFTRKKWGVEPEESYGQITTEDRAEALSVLSQVAPHLRDNMRGGQVFCDAYSKTGAPIVTPVAKSGRIIFAGAAYCR